MKNTGRKTENMQNDRYSKIVDEINRAKDIAVYCHTNPDGDALSSLLALGLALESLGKEVKFFCDCPVPDKYKCLKGSDLISLPDKRTYSLAISVDCASIDRLGGSMRSFLSARKQIAIDHHSSFERFCEITLVEGGAAACAQIVYKLLKKMKLVNKDIAGLIFAGIVTDSGCFQFSNTTKETHLIACELLDYDIPASDIIYNVFRRTDKAKFNLKTRVLSKAEFFENDSIALIVFSKKDFEETNTDTSCTEGIISELIDISTVEVAYALSEVGQKNYKLSIRTKNDVDASDIAMTFGGGGHFNAAGARVNGFLEDIKEKLIKLAKDRI